MENNDLRNSLEAVIKTLECVEIKATYDNLDKMLGCQQVLRTIISNLEEENVTEENNGNSDSE